MKRSLRCFVLLFLVLQFSVHSAVAEKSWWETFSELKSKAGTYTAAAIQSSRVVIDKQSAAAKVALGKAEVVAKEIADHSLQRAAELTSDLQVGGQKVLANGGKTMKEALAKMGDVRLLGKNGSIAKLATAVGDNAVEKVLEIRDSGQKMWTEMQGVVERTLTEMAPENDVKTTQQPQPGTFNLPVCADSECLIQSQIDSIIEMKAAGKEFYLASARRVTKTGAAGCVLGALIGALTGAAAGPLGAAVGAAGHCAGGGFLMGLLAALDAPFKHWGEATQAAYRARRAYSVSFEWLDIDAHELVGKDQQETSGLVNARFRKCALRYHPDKLPEQTPQAHREKAELKFANCKFAKAYILAFQKKYGLLDPLDAGSGAQEFLKKFAGVWAAQFGCNDCAGSLSAHHVAEWLSAIKQHAEL